MKISTKGRVTIPKPLRDEAGLIPGTEVQFFQTADGRIYISRLRGKGCNLVERMRGRGTVRMSTGEILALTRGS